VCSITNISFCTFNQKMNKRKNLLLLENFHGVELLVPFVLNE
jgi:hypothetical protein